jgi:aspartyl-tRNA(Asn)/glutamyl-tRNA(Gln) amidotransferase subunit B
MTARSFTATIGLEVHVELATKSKMFCGCRNEPHGSEPNTLICPVCLAHPGTLPVPNEEAIASVLLFGQAVGATPASYSEFDRKQYFYPDIPKAYQLSQYAFPFLTGGSIRDVALTRVHLEEDTARSQHDKGDYSLVDFNRAGVPLMELVTEPVIKTAEEAGNFARELRLILRALGIAEANMERGEMRVEANISVSNTTTFGTKVEVKNLNSFKSVESAIGYEVERQIRLLEEGGVVVQETRGWDEMKQRTYVQRSKETAKDYRYFPDPDIPKMRVNTHEYFSRLNEKMKLLPQEKRTKYGDIGLPINQIETIVQSDFLDEYFSRVISCSPSIDPVTLQVAANYLTSDVVWQRSKGLPMNLKPVNFLALMSMLVSGDITSRVAKDLLPELMETDADPAAVAATRGLLRSKDSGELDRMVAEVLSNNPSVVADFKAGKTAVLQYLVGQVMKASKGTADPAEAANALRANLE